MSDPAPSSTTRPPGAERVWHRGWFFVAGVVALGWFALTLWNTTAGLSLLLLVCTGCGAVALVTSLRSLRLARQMDRWPSASGKMLRSEVRTETRYIDGNYGSEAVLAFSPDVEYEYQYQGHSYRSRKLILVNVDWSRDELEQTLSRYPAGSQVTVWVNPNQPDMAVLERSEQKHCQRYLLGPIIATAFLLLGLGGLLAMYLLR